MIFAPTTYLLNRWPGGTFTARTASQVVSNDIESFRRGKGARISDSVRIHIAIHLLSQSTILISDVLVPPKCCGRAGTSNKVRLGGGLFYSALGMSHVHFSVFPKKGGPGPPRTA